MSRKKKIIAVIALCVLTFALDAVLTVYGPRRSYPTLQEAVEASRIIRRCWRGQIRRITP